MLQDFLNFLFSLRHVRFGPGTRLSFVWNYPALIILGALLLATLGFLSYRRQASSRTKRLWMGIVRGLLLALVLVMLFRPELVVDYDEPTRAVVAVWVDSSMSMALEDPYKDPAMRAFVQQVSTQSKLPEGRLRPNRYELAVAALENANWLKDLTQTQDVMFYTGAAHAQPVGLARTGPEVAALITQLKTRKPTGDVTDVPTVVHDITQELQGQPISALLLLTDGQTTQLGARIDSAVAAARRVSAQVYAVPAGQKDEPFDIKLTRPEIPENTFAGDPVATKIHVAAAGVTVPTGIRVSLFRRQGEHLMEPPLATRDITLDAAKKEMDVELIFKPEKKDNNEKSESFDLLARVEPITPGTDELERANNEKPIHTSVLDAQLNVLYVEGYPRWEFRYLKNELIREHTVNVSTLLVSADDNFAQEGDPQVKDKDGRELFPGPITRFPETREELSKYDVLLIGDVEPAFFSPSQMRLIVDFVRTQGGGIGWIAGRGWNPETYKGTPLEVLLPIIPDEIVPAARVMGPEVPNDSFNLQLTPAGRQSNLFRFFDDPEQNVRQVAELPPMFWYKPIVGLKGSAEVLAVHPTKTLGGLPLPLIVTGRYGEGRTMFSGIADTWRWRRYTGEPLFQSYWLQMCRLLYQNKALGKSRRVTLAAESDSVEVGTPIKITMEVRDPLLTGQIPASVPVQLIDRSQNRPLETITLQKVPSIEGQAEKYEGMTTAQQLGSMQLQFAPGAVPVEVPPFELSVLSPQREKDSTTADVDSLESLAKRTSGQLVAMSQFNDLAKIVPDRGGTSPVQRSEEIWCKPIALLLVVLLATIEWLIRKSAGLV